MRIIPYVDSFEGAYFATYKVYENKHNTRKTTAKCVNHVLRVLIERILEYCKAVKHTRKNAEVVTRSANKLLQICSQFVNKLYSHCLFQVIGTSCKQLVATYKIVLTNLMPSRCNKNVTRQTKQVCNNIVI